MHEFQVFTRWRPQPPNDTSSEIPRQYETHSNNSNLTSINLTPPTPKHKPWKSNPAFTQVFESTTTNETIFSALIPPTLPLVLTGQTCNFFAYGHSGSGKSHTIIGYDFAHDPRNFGLCLSTARALFAALDDESPNSPSEQIGLGLRMYELRKNTAFDLLNHRTKCHIRAGYDGATHLRGETELLPDGKVRVRPIVTRPCWRVEELRAALLAGLALRAVGSSTVHDQSSRTHAVVEVEVVTRALIDARDAVVERQSELVPVAKYATDVYIEESLKAVVKTEEGVYVPNPERGVDQARVDAAEARKREFEERVRRAEEFVEEVRGRKQEGRPALGGKFVFVDLAGSEYFREGMGAAATAGMAKQSPQEQQEGRQINTDLLALKEVIRARAMKQSRIPFRSSPLTMVLRSHFLGSNMEDSYSAMILTVSPSSAQFSATMNTLKYGNLVGAAGSEMKEEEKKKKKKKKTMR
ncbi:hypothetical protein FE257_008402 [Aspergillus nanangensis]|uniref:Kinesin-like protein n=1 Tax=Aspergillus nanangensis TaxID=2582783 RepID=A0AAD4GSM3_ASPNN|nr:hypothetical protein FE257_008402 [Aspergillus nanangensis]